MSVSIVKFISKISFLVPLTASLFSMSAATVAQTDGADGAIEVAFSIQENVDLQSFNVDGCMYVAPSANGSELMYECPLSHVYQVEFLQNGSSDVQTQFGNLQIRPGLSAGMPHVGPLHFVGTYTTDRDASIGHYNELSDKLKPLVLAGLTIETSAPAAKLEASEPVVSTTETIVAQADETPVEPSNQSFIDISWDASYGAIRLNGGNLLEELQEADGLIQGRLVLDNSIGNLFILSSDRNANCNKAYSVEQLTEAQEVFFECSHYTVSVPFKLPLEGSLCQELSDKEIGCLVSNSKKTFEVKLKGWNAVEVVIEEGVDVLEMPLAKLQPSFPVSSIIASLDSASADQCEPKQLELRLGAYCLNDLCTDLSEAWHIDDSGSLQNLSDAGWASDQMPTKAKFILVNVMGEEKIVLGEEIASLDPVPVEEITAMIKKATGNTEVPLSVEVMGKIYKVGRNVRVFSDATCEAPISGKVLDLSNPGNKVPDVPKCSFYRIFDGKKPRSECTAVTYDKEAKTASATLEVASCGAKRLVIYVAENESLNGRNSKAIVAALSNIANGMNDKDQCAAIDIVHTSDAKRDVLLTAEDMWFAADEGDLRSSFDLRFINSNSEILRDFEWVYRTWGDTLGGLIVIADGDKARPRDMIDSPASMAWKIKDVYRRMINFSEKKNCDAYQDILLFQECTQSEADTFDEILSNYVDQGLEALAQESK